ncbi:hypothetical protein WN48_01151 [Eufriesea mexicana]|nr:hypothetical protein WN48_01151 [Eufriesea mexicana]
MVFSVFFPGGSSLASVVAGSKPTKPLNKPEFDDISPRNVTVIVGHTAELNCFIKHRGDRVEEPRNAIVSEPVGDTGFFLPNPRLGRVFANERQPAGFLDSASSPRPRLSITSLCPAEFAQRPKDPVHLGAPEAHAHLHRRVHFQYRVFADRGRRTGIEDGSQCRCPLIYDTVASSFGSLADSLGKERSRFEQ